eukprot:sb/3478987/
MSILRFCRSKSTHPSLRYICYVGRIPAGSIFIKQDRNNPSAKTQNAHNSNLYYLQQTCPILIRSTLTLTHSRTTNDMIRKMLRKLISTTYNKLILF